MRKTLRGLTRKGASRIVRLDSYTGALVVLEQERHMIHEGLLYFSDFAVTGIGKNEQLSMRLQVADSAAWPHLKLKVFCSKTGVVDFLEDPTELSPIVMGNPLDVINMNRNVDNGALTEVYENAEFDTPDGLSLLHTTVGNGKAAGPDQPFILKQGTAYELRFTSLEKTNSMFGGVRWYEAIHIL